LFSHRATHGTENIPDKYLIHGSAIPLADGSGFSVTAHVTHPEGSAELDWHYTLPETSFASIEEAEAAGEKYAAAHVDQKIDQEVERWRITRGL
jgi:hypothetical protein